MMDHIKMLTVFKVAAYIISIWVHSHYNISNNFANNLENLYHVEITSVIRFQRTLAKHLPKKESDQAKVIDRLSGNNSYNNVKCTSDDLSKYSQLKKKGLNNLDLYKKLYNHRYSKKNVIGKFDCYCEKKVFEKIDYIHELKEKLQHDKRSFNKKLDKILIIRLIIFGLVPLIGFIIPLLKTGNFGIIQRCFDDCQDKKHYEGEQLSNNHKDNDYPKIPINESTWNTITYVNFAFTCIAAVIVLCVVLYIMIKVIKYKKLRAGRDKMSLKEYYHFTKSLL